MKNTFCFIQKALFVLEIFKFLYFRLPLFFALSVIALGDDRRYTLTFMTSSIIPILFDLLNLESAEKKGKNYKTLNISITKRAL